MALQSIPRDASKGVGGLSYVLISDFADLAITVDQTTGLATFTLADGSAITSANTPFKRFDMPKYSSNYTVTETGAAAAGTTFYNHSLVMFFKKNNAAKRNAVQVLGQSETVAIAVDNNGNAACLGYGKGLDLTTNTGTTGTAAGDANGQTITLAVDEANPEAFVESAVLSTLIPTP